MAAVPLHARRLRFGECSGRRSGSLNQVYGKAFRLEFRAGLETPRSIGLDTISVRAGVKPGPAPRKLGAVAQLGERLICIQEVAGSIPTSSTSARSRPWARSSDG